MSGTRISDSGLTILGRLKSLEILRVECQGVTAGGLVHLRGLTRLRELEISDYNMSDASVKELQKLPKLKVIRH